MVSVDFGIADDVGAPEASFAAEVDLHRERRPIAHRAVPELRKDRLGAPTEEGIQGDRRLLPRSDGVRDALRRVRKVPAKDDGDLPFPEDQTAVAEREDVRVPLSRRHPGRLLPGPDRPDDPPDADLFVFVAVGDDARPP